MAGAAVFQLEPFPIGQEHIMTEAYAVDTPFYDNIADYVYKPDNLNMVCEYLAESLSKWNNETRKLVVITRDAENRIQTIMFKKGFKEAYFAGAYAEFMKRLTELSQCATPASFVEGRIGMRLFELNSAYNEEFGDYVCTNECEFITFDEFIRAVEVDVPFYLGSVMNYHF